MHSSSSNRLRRRHPVTAAATLGLLFAAAGIVQPTAASAATHDNRPAAPTDLRTSPITSCAGDTIVGDGDVTLYAKVSDPDGGILGVDFRLSPHGSESGDAIAESDPGQVAAPSGSSAGYVVRKDVLESAAGGSITEFDWKVRATDSQHSGDWSTVCHFSFDPTRTGAPVISEPVASTIGQPLSIAVSAPSGGTVPSGYRYQLNGGAPVDVPADASGNATFTVTPTSRTNTLSVTSLSAGGNYGETASIVIISDAPSTHQADGDLTGDNVPDLVTVGAQNGFPSGLWLAPGTGDGHVSTSPSDIGVNGDGRGSNGSSSDFDGSTVITGRFTGGTEQDVLVYFPDGVYAGTGMIVKGSGDGSPLDPVSGNAAYIRGGSLQDVYGDNPVQLANAGNTSGRHTGFPDLIGVSGDGANGYALNLYLSGFNAGLYFPLALDVTTPDGTADWNDWTIATTQLPAADGGSSTTMFLWNKSTGELDLWENLAADPDTGSLTYTAYPVATRWNVGAALNLQAADANGDGVPDLWAVSQGGTVGTNLFTDLSSTAPATLTSFTETLSIG
ncbi:hypothetical protein [Streptomyces sp. ME18-1-4]|uniref:hypothetical protein n=1 Tax=Streptomyces sp. ME18-1-4 TaxID=3028685 RepID=UPI0029A2F2F9|nr:hypothetical protein [Streptomyces sp. ME18-1-4]MDX3245097.1 hypothetical protein [Streptomyces sp. ME18-1-4]